MRAEIDGLARWQLFDHGFYGAANPHVIEANWDPLQHYVLRGAAEGRAPHPLFDTAWYLAHNPDVAGSGANPLLHYLDQGWREQRNPHPLFDGNWYLRQNPDVAASQVNPLIHYIREGWQEARDPHPLFAGAWYRQHSPESAANEPLAHYLRLGWKEGRNPHPQFDAAFYVEQLAGTEARTENPLLHYLSRGAAAGLDPGPTFDTSFYLERYPDLGASGINPLTHYVLFGAAEGRWPNQWHADLHLQQLPTVRGNEEMDRFGRRRLARLLSNNEELRFPKTTNPQTSVILIATADTAAHNFLLCLESIYSIEAANLEIIVVESGATPELHVLLERSHGIVRLESESTSWAEASAYAAARSSGSALLFLSSHALLEPSTIQSALQCLRDGTGVVGARVLDASGVLEEAGAILWRDGSTTAYGRDDLPSLLPYEFQRPVDFCSRHFLLTRRELFESLGGFDTSYAPGSLAEADYCLKVRRAGAQVIYNPESVIRLSDTLPVCEGESSGNAEALHRFAGKWRSELADRDARSDGDVTRARIAAQAAGLRIVYFEDRIPHAARGTGYPRSRHILHELVRLGHHVTCAAMIYPPESAVIEYAGLDRRIELVDGTKEVPRLWREYLPAADLLWVSRPHNLARLLEHLPDIRAFRGKLIYDAEAIYTPRERLLAEMRGSAIPEKLFAAQQQRELALAMAADAVVVVSSGDERVMREAGARNLHVLNHTVAAQPGANAFGDRNTILFVGSVPDPQNPNADAIRYLCETVWRELSTRVEGDLVIAGFGTDRNLPELRGDRLRVLGPVSDLAAVYNQARLFVAPARYAAGIPLKVCEAAAAGVPCVVSKLLGNQLGWHDGRDLLIANNPGEFVSQCSRLYQDQELWQALRHSALDRVITEMSAAVFSKKLVEILASVTD